MTPKKKASKSLDKLYVVVPTDSIVTFRDLKLAQEHAKDEVAVSEDCFRVLEVVNSWYVYIPETPDPTVAEEPLDELE